MATSDARAVQNDRHLRVAVAGSVVPADHDAERDEQDRQCHRGVHGHAGRPEQPRERLDDVVGLVEIENDPATTVWRSPVLSDPRGTPRDFPGLARSVLAQRAPPPCRNF